VQEINLFYLAKEIYKMSENKKYFYLKLKDSFFSSEEMLVLESLPDGLIYQNIYLRMCLLSLKNDGALTFKNMLPYDLKMLATVLRIDIAKMKLALEMFEELGLVTKTDNEVLFMSDIQTLIGKSSTEAERIASYRKRIAGCTKGVQMLQDCTPELKTDIELKKDTDIDTEKKGIKQSLPPKHKNGTYQNVLLSDKEIAKLNEELGTEKSKAVIDNFSELKEMKGYKYKSDYLAIKKWGIEAYNQKCKPVHKEQYTDEEYKAGSMDPEKESF
jgi:predicted phage replisome organizer